MSRRTKLIALVTSLSGGLFTAACANGVMGNAALAGRWGGVLGEGPGALRLVLEITEGQPIVLITIDQNNGRIPVSGGRLGHDELDLQFQSVRGRLKLKRDAAGQLIGTWTQGGERPLTLTPLANGQNPVAPPPVPFGTLQEEVDKARAASGAPALGAAFIAKRGANIVAQEAVAGVLVAGETAPVALGQKWHVGSITKSMTATLVARLVERKLLSWDMTIDAAFGKTAPDMLAAYRTVTLSQLMTGRSCMPTNIGIPDLLGHLASSETPTQRRLVWVRQALAMKPENAPGAGFVYPNNGFVLAGALCEAVTGKAYEALMSEEVFAPLGMASAGFGPPPLGNPQGHRKALIGGRPLAIGVDSDADNPAAMAPAGRAHMSLPDLCKFGFAHSEGHQGLRNDYLSQETWRRLHTPPVRTPNGNNYAYGWIARRDGTVWHNGSNTYWLAELAFDPVKGFAGCSCASMAGTEPATGRLLATALAKAAAA
jgi:CubicO group peptidase (beta-lactamase class C family)